jgi:hypothetical protein
MLIYIVAFCVVVVLVIGCVCMMCKRRRQQRLNPSFTVHTQSRYIKVDGRIVGKNLTPNPVVFNAPNYAPLASSNNHRHVQQNNRAPNRQVQGPTIPQNTNRRPPIINHRPNQVQFQAPSPNYPHIYNKPLPNHLRPPVLSKHVSQ